MHNEQGEKFKCSGNLAVTFRLKYVTASDYEWCAYCMSAMTRRRLRAMPWARTVLTPPSLGSCFTRKLDRAIQLDALAQGPGGSLSLNFVTLLW
jgi:hypothetical protein